MKPSLDEVSSAVTAVVPIVTILRAGSLKHCYGSAAVGATIMRSYGFDAHAVLRDALVVHPERGCIHLGYASREEQHRRLLEHGFTVSQDMEATWVDGEPKGGHAVIDCEGLTIDVAIGQVNQIVRGLFPRPGLRLRAELGAAYVINPNEVEVSWHQPEASPSLQAHLARAIELTEGSDFYAQCWLEVRSLLRAGMKDWCPTWDGSRALRLLDTLGFEVTS